MKGHSIASRHLAMRVLGENSKLGCGEKEAEERAKKKEQEGLAIPKLALGQGHWNVE